MREHMKKIHEKEKLDMMHKWSKVARFNLARMVIKA